MPALELTSQLIRFASVSHVSNVDVAGHLEGLLRGAAGQVERIDYTDQDGIAKANVIARFGAGQGGLAYFGHTDVVPADRWFDATGGPFNPTVQDDRLYGRGSCDMKGSVAAFITALLETDRTALNRPVYVVLTADEEVGYHGAAAVAARSELYREIVEGDAAGIIGEPTELKVVYAHKGICAVTVRSTGTAAHSSTGRGVNANLAMIPFLTRLKDLHDELEVDPRWQHAEFQPTSVTMNFCISDHNEAVNVTSAESVCQIFFRPTPSVPAEDVVTRIEGFAADEGLAVTVEAAYPPMYTDPHSPFISELCRLAGTPAASTVSYGTDGAIFGELKRIAVLGPGSISQAHTVDEFIELDQLERGVALYRRVIEHYAM